MFHVHSATDLRPLAAMLTDVLSVPPADPMAPDWVAVPSAGMRTWVSLELSRRLGTSNGRADGVSANIEFRFPGSLRSDVLTIDRGTDTVDPWAVERLVWAVLDVSTHAAQLGIGRLPSLLVEAPEGGSRYSAARRVADLFDRYHLHRPEMIQNWARGVDVGGVGEDLHPQHRWQAELWRAVRESIGSPSPAERRPEIIRRLRSGELNPDLPPRVCVFGMSLLPGGAGFLELAAALGTHRDVHLFVIGPSARLAEAATADLPGALPSGAARKRSELEDLPPPAHPLLRSWGRLHRETAVLLVDAARSGAIADGAWEQQPTDPAASPATLLERLQFGIRADVPPGADLDVAPDDRSVSFHACHGATRQVEVLRDQILGLLRDNPDLDEDDVLVVCPDLETFAPVIEATLGPSAHIGTPVGGGRGEIELRYTLADRSIGSSAPLVGAFLRMLDLVTGRFDAPSVLDFLALDPVQLRYRLSEDDLATVADWVSATRTRWGLHPEHRARHDLPVEIETNTWRASTNRLLVGAVSVGSDLDVTIGDVVPYDNEGSNVAVAGRLAEVLWRLEGLADDALTARPLSDWTGILRTAIDDFLAVPRDQQWQRERLLRTLGEITESATDPDSGVGAATPLTFTDVRRLVEERLGGITGRPSFFRGGVTFTSLTPLRWVPYPIVCLLGMDTAALGSSPADGDDLAALDPLVGDRDRRAEVRQSLLETVLGAERHLVVVRDGADVRTNQTIPMPVALAELRDVVLALATPSSRPALADRLETQHPRQPFDEQYFVDDSLPRSFDVASLRGAAARRARSSTEPAFLGVRLESEVYDEVQLADLRRFLRCPVRAFLEQRLDLRLPQRDDAVRGILDVTLGGLDGYASGRRLLELLADMPDADEAQQVWRERESLTGAAPPGTLGDRELDKFGDEAVLLRSVADDLGVAHGAEPCAIDVRLDDGTRVTGTVGLGLDAIHGDDRRGPGSVLFSRHRPEHTLSLWLDLAVLTLADTSVSWRGAMVLRAATSRSTKPSVIDLELVDPLESAADALSTVVDLYRRGMCEPLPLFRTFSDEIFRKPDTSGGWPGRYPEAAEFLVYGHLGTRDLLSIPVEPDDPEGDAQGRAARFAEVLFGAVQRTSRAVER